MNDRTVDAGWLGRAQGGGLFRPRVARLFLITGLIIYIKLLSCIYHEIISELFAYYSFVYFPKSLGLVACGWLVAILPSLWMPIALERPSCCIYWILYLIVYVPASIIPWYWGQADSRDLLAFVFVLLVVFSLVGIVHQMPLLRIATSKPCTLFWFVIALMSAAFFSVIISSCGLSLHFVDLEDAYTVRGEYKGKIEESGRLAGRLITYVMAWQSNVINNLLMSHGLVRRKWSVFSMGLIGQILIYCLTGYRSVLFSWALILMLLLALWRGGRLFGPLIVWSMVGVVLLSAITYSWFESLTIISLLRRLIIMPGVLTGQYIDFFSMNPHSMLGDGFLHAFVDYPYSLPVANIIGEQYYGSSTMAANVHIFADGYACFGFIGMLIYGAILAVVMWLLDCVYSPIATASDGDLRVAVLMFGISALDLSNSGIFTTLVQHGMLLMGILLYFYPRDFQHLYYTNMRT